VTLRHDVVIGPRGHQDNPWALNKIICDADGDREALLGLVEGKGEDFNAVNVTTCLNR
jgi:hypothetical protein